MRGIIVGVLFFIALGGCSDPAVEQCTQFIQSKLRSPSTFRAIETRSVRMTTLQPEQVWVTIDYDAANAYGTPIRDRQICKFPSRTGKADTSNPAALYAREREEREAAIREADAYDAH